MKNLKSFTSPTIEVHKEAVRKKNEGDRKNRLVDIEDTISSCYDNYSNGFNNDQLLSLQPHGFDLPEKDDLLSLYSYDSATIKSFRTEIRKQQPRGIRSICQNCTIDSVSTLDHIIPKEDFPEYAVNPLNLFPCCSSCNSKKSNIWRNDEELLFLNLYIDILPETQYLFFRLNGIDLDDFEIEYRLENKAHIDENVFEKIQSHFNRLDLLNRMAFRASDEVDTFIVSIENDIEKHSREEITSIVEEDIEKLRGIYGFNHWSPVMKQELINSDVFWDWITE